MEKIKTPAEFRYFNIQKTRCQKLFLIEFCQTDLRLLKDRTSFKMSDRSKSHGIFFNKAKWKIIRDSMAKYIDLIKQSVDFCSFSEMLTFYICDLYES